MLSSLPCIRYRILQHPLRATLCTSSASTTPISSLSTPPCRHSPSQTSRSYSTTPSPSKVIFSGIQPTGIPHIGNYLGALQNWKKLQDEAKDTTTKLLFSVVDLHAITIPQKPKDLRKWRREAMASLLACGLGDGSTLFFQSQVC
jgi:tryptophanyl-tRNA synthetase